MLTSFEQFAVTEMMGKTDTPPRANGTLCFSSEWERTAFGVALALARNGYFEWDDFRDELIAEIGAWEPYPPGDRSSWNYYERWLAALERAVVKTALIDPAELSSAFAEAAAEPHAA
ncbi:putative transmembrane nitrile hydratase [Azorhizobium caulinodans ORS 571]|uniref:Putative transmembrane nitrile hydratase n=1 Tax=Azorhizobium caulinodans (strain ATCC 43989 / DSM 5975 / JCM 20966 / LMG 6465 / NBRC 14845 / NCIMB 13405 / ORS 571) TaxID=438753 RepID=A8INW0_AZOC5|nr:nitrile hydratase accessory protein [Azorhizobium caulinodans]BAF89794.1 putative transmembrane nitrile hydratase [Azorhizobium caulinodans ORS 571]